MRRFQRNENGSRRWYLRFITRLIYNRHIELDMHLLSRSGGIVELAKELG